MVLFLDFGWRLTGTKFVGEDTCLQLEFLIVNYSLYSSRNRNRSRSRNRNDNHWIALRYHLG